MNIENFDNVTNTSNKADQRSMGMAIIFDVESKKIFSEIISKTNLTESDINHIAQEYNLLIEKIKTDKLPKIIRRFIK